MFMNCLKIAFIIIICTGEAQSREKSVRSLNISYPFKHGSYLNIDTYKGSVNISSWEKEEIQIRAEIEATVGGKKGKEQTDLADIKIKVKDDRIIIKSDYQRLKTALNIEDKKDCYEENRHPLKWLLDLTRPLLPDVHYDIKLPKQASIKIEDYRSQIDIVGLNGFFDLYTFKGKIKLEDIAGELTSDTFKGNVIIKDAKCGMSLETFKGYFNLSLPKNTSFDLDVTIKKDREVYDIPFYWIVPIFVSKKDIVCEFPFVKVKQDNRVVREINGGGPLIKFVTYKGKMVVKKSH